MKCPGYVYLYLERNQMKFPSYVYLYLERSGIKYLRHGVETVSTPYERAQHLFELLVVSIRVSIRVRAGVKVLCKISESFCSVCTLGVRVGARARVRDRPQP